MSAYRYEGPKVKEDAAKSEAKALLNAIKNNHGDHKKKAMEEDEVVRILTTRSKPHLKQVYDQYKKISAKTITEVIKNKPKTYPSMEFLISHLFVLLLV